MAYEAKTQNDLAKWWVIGTGSVVNRLSEIMDDCPLGPAIYYTTGWTASGSEWYRTQATANDSCQEKIGAGAWSALALGSGIGALNAGEYFYDIATTALYVRLTGDVAPSATNQVRAHYVWDGAGAGPAFMTEVVEDRIYRIHKDFEIGEGTTSTTLSFLDESVVGDDSINVETQANATLSLGVLVGDWGTQGAYLNLYQRDGSRLADGGNVKIYGSMVKIRGTSVNPLDFYSGTLDIRNSIIQCSEGLEGSSNYKRSPFFRTGLTSINLQKVVFSNIYELYFFKNPEVAEDIHVHSTTVAVLNGQNNLTLSLIDLLVTSYTAQARVSGISATLIIIDSDPIITKIIDAATGLILQKYTVAIHVADKTGADLAGATVTWLDSQSNTGNDTTDASGDVSFTITSKQWAGTSETLTDFNTFTFTISKAGKQTLVYENITLSEAVDWHVELQNRSVSNLNFSDLVKVF